MGALALLLLGSAATVHAGKHIPTYAGLHGEVLLENSRVLVERFALQPGDSTGRHAHPDDQLLVYIKGGVLKSAATGRSALWRDGRVVWQGASDRVDAGDENAGTTAVIVICVTFKPTEPTATVTPRDTPRDEHLNYPNIPGEDLLENDRVIVQRFIVNPGQWEGVHAHRPNMLYIHVKGGLWAARSRKEPQHTYPEPDTDGDVGWMPAIDISEGHESGNVGKEPIDLIWVTLKH
jgi:quercetin dioxygenase-like cupin family protein